MADPTPPPVTGLFDALSGRWSCSGAFADGRALESDLTFTPEMDGRVLRYTHVDRPPNEWMHEAVWGVDTPSGHLLSLAVSGKASTHETTPMLFVAETWEPEAVMLVADTLRTPPWAPNRFSYSVEGDTLRMVWEIGRGGGWQMGDYLDCQRAVRPG